MKNRLEELRKLLLTIDGQTSAFDMLKDDGDPVEEIAAAKLTARDIRRNVASAIDQINKLQRDS